VREIPENVDFVISNNSGNMVLSLIDDWRGEERQMHPFSIQPVSAKPGGQTRLNWNMKSCADAETAGIRLIGPNCMGVYYPGWGMSWTTTMSNQPGAIGFLSQSGSAAYEIIESAEVRGMHFSKAVSYGNALDFNECDYLEYFGEDAATKIIMIYIEGVRRRQEVPGGIA